VGIERPRPSSCAGAKARETTAKNWAPWILPRYAYVIPLEHWPTLQGAGRLASYIRAQKDESPELTHHIRRTLSALAEEAVA
jgi:hypothetical protein